MARRMHGIPSAEPGDADANRGQDYSRAMETRICKNGRKRQEEGRAGEARAKGQGSEQEEPDQEVASGISEAVQRGGAAAKVFDKCGRAPSFLQPQPGKAPRWISRDDPRKEVGQCGKPIET